MNSPLREINEIQRQFHSLEQWVRDHEDIAAKYEELKADHEKLRMRAAAIEDSFHRISTIIENTISSQDCCSKCREASGIITGHIASERAPSPTTPDCETAQSSSIVQRHEYAGPAQTLNDIPEVLLNSEDEGDEDNWKVHFDKKAPRATSVIVKNITWSQISSYLKMDLVTENKLEASSLLLESSQIHRIHQKGAYILVIDPIFIDNRQRGRTMLIDWGTQEDNERMAERIRQLDKKRWLFLCRIPQVALSAKKELITLLTCTQKHFHKKPSSWAFIGGWYFKIAYPECDVWGRLSEQNRNDLLNKLKRRDATDRWTVEEIKHKLDNGEWRQLCVEIYNDKQLNEESQDEALRITNFLSE